MKASEIKINREREEHLGVLEVRNSRTMERDRDGSVVDYCRD